MSRSLKNITDHSRIRSISYMNIWKSQIKAAINSTPRNNAGAYSLEEKSYLVSTTDNGSLLSVLR